MRKALLMILVFASISSINYAQDVTGTIWEDFNGNGTDDDGTPLVGITVNLTDCTSGNVIAGPEVTDANGEYTFVGVPASATLNYCIEIEDFPAGVWCTTEMSGESDADDDLEVTEPFAVGTLVNPPTGGGTLNAGFFQNATIEGEIYEEGGNNDGTFEGSEALYTGCVDVCIIDVNTGATALACDGSDLCLTGVTSGAYDFTDIVPPGEYFVQFTFCGQTDCGADAFLGNNGSFDLTASSNNDVDEANGDLTTSSFIIESGGNPTEVDMGVFGAGTISGEVWEDLNGDGVQDGGEGPLAGVEVCLEISSGIDALDIFGAVVACTTTDGGGNYMFENLPPLDGQDYKIIFDEDPNIGGDDYFLTMWAGAGVDPTSASDDSDACQSCTPANGCTNDFLVASCEDVVDIDAGYYRPVTVGGKVFKDGDGDGCFGGSPDFAWDAPEVSGFVPGISVSITLNGGGAVTDVNGNAVAAIIVDGSTVDGVYCFEDLPPGDYIINFANPGAPWMFSERADNLDPTTNTTDCTDADPAGGSTVNFVIESGEGVNCGDIEEVNLGLYKLLTIGGLVFNDSDLNCVQDGMDGLLGNVTLIVTGTGCPGGNTFGPIVVDNDIVTAEWILQDLVPPCDCIMVTIDPTEFDVNTGGTLANHVTCGSAEDWDEFNAGGITNNGAGSEPNIMTAGCIEMFCGIIPDDNGMSLLTIDFGFTFQCIGSTTTPLYPTCEEAAETTGCNSFNYLCGIEPLNNYCGTMDAATTGSGPNPLCSVGGGVSHNTYWLSFIAGVNANDFDVDLFVSTCTGGGGVQWGIVEDCGFTEVVCDGSCSGSSIYNIVAPLVPGEQYWLWVDGCNTDVCDIEFTVNDGGDEPVLPTVVESSCDDCLAPSDPAVHDYFVCTGASAVMFCVDAADGSYADSNLEFYWNIDDVVDGNPSETGQDANLGFIEDNCWLMDFSDVTAFPAGDYELCMTWVGTCCDAKGPLCMTVHIEDQAPEVYAPITACWDDEFPITPDATDPANAGLVGWGGAPIDEQGAPEGPDTYMVTATDFPILGCSIEQSVVITDIIPGQGIINDVICSDIDPFEYIVGQDLSIEFAVNPLPTNPGGDMFTWPGEAANGCDSFLVVNIQVIELEGFITESPCTDDGITLNWENTGPELSDYQNVKYTWKLDGVPIMDNDNDETDLDDISVEGIYTFCIEAELFSDFQNMPVVCTWTSNELNVQFENPPPPTIETDNEEVCADDAMGMYCIDAELLTDVDVNWVIANGGAAMTVGPTNQACVTIDWTGSNGGIVLALINSVCGENEGEVQVAVVASPTASIAPIMDVCINTPTTIVYDGIPNPGATFLWDTPNGAFTAGADGPTGPGPHTVSWSTPGPQMVALQVMQGECTSDEVIQMVNIIAPPLEPTITCSESSTEIVFTVTDPNMPAILGNYTITHTPAIGTGSQAGNVYTVSGLNPNDVVTISVDYEDTSGFCPGGTVMGMCTAQNCTDPELFFDEVSDVCLEGGAATILLNAGSNAGIAGTATFDGPGTSATGDFNPNMAGAGTHVINLTYNTTAEDCNFFSSITINVVEQPVATFTVESPVCISNSAMIEFDNAAGGITPTNFAWDIGDAIAPMTGLNGGGPHELTFPMPGTYLISLTTSVLTNGGADECVSVLEMMEIVVDDVLPDPGISCMQTTSSVTFSWTEDPNASSYTTDITAPAYATINEMPGSAAITDLNEDDEVIITVTAVSDNSCPDVTAMLPCAAIACQFTNVGVDDLLLCDGAAPEIMTYTLSDPSILSGNETYTWSINTPSGDGIDAVTGEVNASAAGPGNWVATLTVVDGDCTWDGDADVTVLPGGTASITQIGPFCWTDTAVMLEGEVTGTTLDNPVVTWMGEGVSNGMFDPSAVSSDGGMFTIEYTVVDGDCEYFATIDVLVDPELAVIVIDCQPSDDMVVFTWNDDPCAASYEVTSTVPGTLNGTTYTVMDLMEGQTVEITVTMVSDCECTTPPVTTDCTANPCPQIAITLDNPFENGICDGSMTTPFSITPDITGSNGTGVGTWGGGVDANGMFDPTQGPGVYNITYDFVENACPFTSTTSIEIFENPTALVMVADPGCYQDNFGTIIVDPSGGNGSLTVTIDGNAVVANESNQVALTTHNIVVMDQNLCRYEEVVTVQAAVQPPLDIVGELQGIFPNELTFDYESDVINVDSIVWTLSDTVICNNCETISVDGMIDNEELCATLYFNNGCSIEDCKQVSIRQVTKVFFPNIISPNEDGFNDELIVGSNAIESVNSVYVYDRWGELIKSDDDGVPPSQLKPNEWILWDGTFKEGKSVVPGVYVFVIEYTDTNGDIIVEGHDVTVLEGKY